MMDFSASLAIVANATSLAREIREMQSPAAMRGRASRARAEIVAALRDIYFTPPHVRAILAKLAMDEPVDSEVANELLEAVGRLNSCIEEAELALIEGL